MQIIGRNLPQLQNVVTSGLDSVTQGLVQNSSEVAAQGLAVIKDSFVAAGLNATTLNPESSVQSEGGFQSPGTYFNQAGPELSEKFAAMSAALNNQNLRPESVIGNFAGSLGDLNSKIGSFADSPGAEQGIIIIGGRFQPSPPPIAPDPPPIAPQNSGPQPPPIRVLAPNPPPIDVLSPDGPPIAPQLNADQRTALAIGGIFQPQPPPIVPNIMMPNPPPIREMPVPPPIRVLTPNPPPIDVLAPDGPPIVPNTMIPNPPPIRELGPNPPPIDVLVPDGPPIREMPSPPPIMPESVLTPQPPPITPGPPPIIPTATMQPTPPPIKIGDQLSPTPPPIREFGEIFSPQPPPIREFGEVTGPSPPPIMPNEIFQSQLQTLRDMETTVRQSTNLYQQLNSAMFNRNT